MTVSCSLKVGPPNLTDRPLPKLLNTVSNLGGTWPRFFVLKGALSPIRRLTYADQARFVGVDAFSEAICVIKDDNIDLTVKSECPLVRRGGRNPLNCLSQAPSAFQTTARQLVLLSAAYVRRHAMATTGHQAHVSYWAPSCS